MNSLRQRVQREDLIGSYLAEIGLGAGSLALRLLKPSARAGLSTKADVVISGIAILRTENQCYQLESSSTSVTALVPLLNADVTDVHFERNESVRIYFGANLAVEICRDAAGFESASIRVPGRDVLVI